MSQRGKNTLVSVLSTVKQEVMRKKAKDGGRDPIMLNFIF